MFIKTWGVPVWCDELLWAAAGRWRLLFFRLAVASRCIANRKRPLAARLEQFNSNYNPSANAIQIMIMKVSKGL